MLIWLTNLFLYICRQLANARSGFPLFEIYITMGDDGEYKQQVCPMSATDLVHNRLCQHA